MDVITTLSVLGTGYKEDTGDSTFSVKFIVTTAGRRTYTCICWSTPDDNGSSNKYEFKVVDSEQIIVVRKSELEKRVTIVRDSTYCVLACAVLFNKAELPEEATERIAALLDSYIVAASVLKKVNHEDY